MTPARLLIVDDDPDLRQFLSMELAVEGHLCEQAASGQEALAQIRSAAWDLVLLDWTLPDFSGVEVCRRLRQAGIKTPVLMLTARKEEPDRIQGLSLGADDYLTKPFSPLALLREVDGIAASRPSRA